MEVDAGKPNYNYRGFGELSLKVYCLLQRTRSSRSLPVVEKREAYMLPNQSSFSPLEGEHLLPSPRRLTTAEDASVFSLKSELRKECCQFLQHFLYNVLSTPPNGKVMSCFCFQIFFGGDEHCLFHLFERCLMVFLIRPAQKTCGIAIQGGILVLRQRAEAAGRAFYEDPCRCGSHPVVLCLSG